MKLQPHWGTAMIIQTGEDDWQIILTNTLSSEASQQMNTEYWPFSMDKDEENIAFDMPGLRLLATVPDAFMRVVPGETASETRKLKNEIYQHTGITGESEQYLYLGGIMTEAFECLWTSFVVVRTQ
jgi:hypothetical protein